MHTWHLTFGTHGSSLNLHNHIPALISMHMVEKKKLRVNILDCGVGLVGKMYHNTVYAGKKISRLID